MIISKPRRRNRGNVVSIISRAVFGQTRPVPEPSTLFGLLVLAAEGSGGAPGVVDTGGGGLLPAPAAPTLTLISGASDNTPNFTLDGDLAVNDVVRFQYSTDSGFSGASETTNTIDAGEDAANEIAFATGTLADGTWYFRARIERPGHVASDWSNTQTETINTSEDAATTAWVNAVVSAGGAVSTTQRGRVNTLIVALKAHSLFSTNSRLWLHAGESDSKQAIIDIMGLATATSAGHSPTLTAGGFTGNGTSQYLLASAPSDFGLLSASFGVYDMTTGTTGGTETVMGYSDGAVNSDFTPIFGGGGVALYRIVQGGGANVQPTNVNRQGLYIITLTAANTTTFYKNGASIGTSGNTAGGTSPLDFVILGRNDSGTPENFSTDKVGASYILAGVNSTQAANFSTDLNAYMTAWGVNVY